MQFAAGGAHFRQNAQHCMGVAASQSAHGADAATFRKQFHNLDGLYMVDPNGIQQLRFRKCFAAANAAVTLHSSVAVLKMAETLGFALAAMAVHLTLSRRGHKVTAYRKIQQLWASDAFCCGPAVF
jgi:hypothetical protein